jgi:hypothetical protein
MTRIGLVAIGSACLCLAAVTTSSADPIILTGGSFIQNGLGDGFFELEGDGFHLAFGAEFPNVDLMEQCYPCTASGRPLTFGASAGGDFRSGLPGTFNGVPYATTFFSGQFVFTGPTLSSALLSPSNLTLTAPFSMTGNLTDFTSPMRQNPVFTTALAGSGTATAQFSFEGEHPGTTDLFDVRSVTFAFESPAATPEPASILLFGTACLCLAGLRRRELFALIEKRGNLNRG